MEAAAQSSSAFNIEDQAKIGFLAIAKNIKLLGKLEDRLYILRLKKEAEINQYKQFSFEAYSQNNNTNVASGSFTLVIDG
ncbi:MAG TPA: hypothetical protein VIM88_00500 [Sulfurovum sp.]|uniref:hypothetical protein n=1 Tax=Sulfurovum sp. TaxID=1969726 RepID=UPI002F95AD71